MRRTTAWRAVGLTGAAAVIGAGMSALAAAPAASHAIVPGPTGRAGTVGPVGTRGASTGTPARTRGASASSGTPVRTRDPLRWPFARTSIWNTPLGSRARYLPARIASTGFGIDVDWFVVTRAEDRAVPVYRPAGSGQSPCRGTAGGPQAPGPGPAVRRQHLPRSLVIPGAGTGADSSSQHDSSAVLQPDGTTLVRYAATARCTPGGPLYGRWSGETSLFGDGIAGGHTGSGMSSIGGSIRTGELTGTAPLRHALKIEVSARYLFYDVATGGERWPARRTDPDAPGRYAGTVQALRMGALLALAPAATAQRLGVRSAAGRRVLAALRDYGAYVVDVSRRDGVDLCVEHSAAADFARRTGHTLDADPGFRADMVRMVRALAVVDDNGPSSIGGHGARRAAWAPPFRAAAASASAPGAAPSPSGLTAARIADVESSDLAPTPAIWAVAGGALGLLALGLWSGRRLLSPRRLGGLQRQA
jgi:hypothetical protein